MDRHLLPRTADDAGHLYVDRARIDREDGAIVVWDQEGKIPVPAATLSVLLLGPGSTITHAAVLLLAEVDCLISWVGECEERFYATGSPDRGAGNLLRQARAWADPVNHLAVVHRMYAKRFAQPIAAGTPVAVLRGREGLRVRATYAAQSTAHGVPWSRRTSGSRDWASADPINRAISAAHVTLYGVVHSAIIGAGFSPALGFIHTGSSRSFVFDIADLYKDEVAVPTAFRVVAESPQDVEGRVRTACRGAFRSARLFDRIVADIDAAIGSPREPSDDQPHLWDPPTEVAS